MFNNFFKIILIPFGTDQGLSRLFSLTEMTGGVGFAPGHYLYYRNASVHGNGILNKKFQMVPPQHFRKLVSRVLAWDLKGLIFSFFQIK